MRTVCGVTYSIVAFDRDAGQWGVAVQSHYFAVGSVVPWAEAGVGAVATQSIAERSYGPNGLDRMRSGDSASVALAALTAEDGMEHLRQVAMVDAAGGVAVHTGANCIGEAGHVTGDGWSVQANMMTAAGVPDAMAAAYEGAAAEPLVDRLLLALDAAEAAGGDIRGRQSAAMLVVDASFSAGTPLVDVRVDDHADPLAELRRLVRVAEAYRSGDPAAGDAVMPANPELHFWRGVALAVQGDVDAARLAFERPFAAGPEWAELLRRLPASGLFPDDPALLAALLPN